MFHVNFRAGELERRRTASNSPALSRAALGVNALNHRRNNNAPQQQQQKQQLRTPSAPPPTRGQHRPNVPKTNPSATSGSNNKALMDADPTQMLNAWLGELDSLQKVIMAQEPSKGCVDFRWFRCATSYNICRNPPPFFAILRTT